MNNKMTMPHNIEAEEALLGTLLIDSEIAIDVIGELDETDFYSEANKLIFDAMQRITNRSGVIDVITLCDELALTNNLSKIGGETQVTRLTTVIPSSSNYNHYLKIVKDYSIRRKLIRAGQTTIDMATNPKEDLNLIAEAEQMVYDISSKTERRELEEVAEACNEVVKKFKLIADDKDAFKGLTTGMKGLNKILNGMQKSDLILIAARPSQGKTSLAMNIVENAAIEANAVCAVFSLEMDTTSLTQRMLCSSAEISMSKAIRGELNMEEWEKIWNAKKILTDTHIYVDDTPSITPPLMLSKCRRIKARQGRLDLIMVDYIQLMTMGGRRKENRQQEISDISRNLKLIAREMGCPLIALSQLSRMVENRQPPIPQLSDLRDSGAIEQDADVVMFIYDPAKANPNSNVGEGASFTGSGNSGMKDIIIAKHRNGELATVPLRWIGEYTKFKDPAGFVNPKDIRAQAEIERNVVENQRMEEFVPPMNYEEPNVPIDPMADVPFDVMDAPIAPPESIEDELFKEDIGEILSPTKEEE